MAACYQGSPPDVGLRQRKGIYSKKGTCCNAKKYSIALCMLYYSLSTSSLIWSSYQANARIVLVIQIEYTWVNQPAFGCRPDLRSSQKHSFFKCFCFVFRWKITKKTSKINKKGWNSKKSILTSFRVGAADQNTQRKMLIISFGPLLVLVYWLGITVL